MTSTRSKPLASLADRITAHLHQRQHPIPAWAIRDLLETRLGDYPLDDITTLDERQREQLVASTVDLILQRARQPDDASPAVLNLNSAGRLITALGLVNHHATLNVAVSKWTALAAMTTSANALVSIGSALSDAERTPTASLLLSPATVAATHQAISRSLTCLRAGEWNTADATTNYELATVLQSALDILPTRPNTIEAFINGVDNNDNNGQC